MLKLDGMKCEMEKGEEFNPGSAYVVKDINQKYAVYLSELGILEQPSITRFIEKLMLVLPNLCSKNL